MIIKKKYMIWIKKFSLGKKFFYTSSPESILIVDGTPFIQDHKFIRIPIKFENRRLYDGFHNRIIFWFYRKTYYNNLIKFL